MGPTKFGLGYFGRIVAELRPESFSNSLKIMYSLADPVWRAKIWCVQVILNPNDDFNSFRGGKDLLSFCLWSRHHCLSHFHIFITLWLTSCLQAIWLPKAIDVVVWQMYTTSTCPCQHEQAQIQIALGNYFGGSALFHFR